MVHVAFFLSKSLYRDTILRLYFLLSEFCQQKALFLLPPRNIVRSKLFLSLQLYKYIEHFVWQLQDLLSIKRSWDWIRVPRNGSHSNANKTFFEKLSRKKEKTYSTDSFLLAFTSLLLPTCFIW